YMDRTYVATQRIVWESGLFLCWIVAVVPAAFYPVEILPSSVLLIADLMPTTHASLILRGFIGQTPELAYWSPAFGWTMLGVSLVVALLVMFRLARWRQP